MGAESAMVKKGAGSAPRQFVPFDSRKALKLLEKRPNNIREVCRALGSDRTTWYWHINNDPEFARAVQEIREACCDSLEENMFKLGSRKSFKTFNDRIAYLRAHRPHLYNPTKRIIVEGHNLTGNEAMGVLAKAQGAVDAEIIKTGLDKEQRRALKQKHLELAGGTGGETAGGGVAR